jgi:hypothetical protein
MAYNYRPTEEKDVKDLGLAKSKETVIINLLKDMKANFGKSADEFITIDTAPANLGNVKILKAFEGMVDLNAYKKKYPGLQLKFGDGSKPSSNAPTTQQQELVTLKIFEELLSSKTKNYKKFEQLLPVLAEIYPNLPFEKSWYASFELQFYQIEKTTKLPNSNFDVYNRDGGFMDYISKLVNSKFNIAKKDSWNPADIWLLKSNKAKHYEEMLDDAVSIQECNAILVDAYNKMDIVGVSLKKNNGKKLNYDLVNLKSSNKDTTVELMKFDLNIPYDEKKKMFTSVTSKVNVKYQGKIYSMGVKSNQASIGNITYEFAGSGSAAFLGKVPKDMLKLELQSDRKEMPEHSHFMKFDKKDFEKKIKVIKANKAMFNITGDLDAFVGNLEQSWTKGRAKDNVVISQIVTFAYIIADMSVTRRKEFIRDLFFMAQKKGPKFGPFGKLH